MDLAQDHSVQDVVGTALTPDATSLEFSSTPTDLLEGDYIEIGTELLLVGPIAGLTAAVTRAGLGSPTAIATNGVGTPIYRVRKLSVHATLPADFTHSPDAASWTLLQPLPTMLLVAVTGVLTNSYGDSPLGIFCTSNNADCGLLLSAPDDVSGVTTLYPPANTDYHLPLGNLLVNVTSTSSGHGPVLICTTAGRW